MQGFAGSQMTSYIRSLPENTPNAVALTMMKTQLPPDAVMTGQFATDSSTGTAIPLAQSGPPGVSCEIVAYYSATIARLGIDNGDMYVELAYDDADGAPTWKPADANTVSYLAGPAGTPDSVNC